MYEPSVYDRDPQVAEPLRPETRFIASMRELARNGYVADPDTEGEGLVLRHKVAPDLMLFPDGTIELVVVQPAKRGGRRATARAPRRISWRRTFLVAFIGAIAWGTSVLLGVAILSG